MINSELLVEVIEHATQEVFSTMLGAQVKRAETGEPQLDGGGVVSLVGLTGQYSGTGTISCNTAAAIEMAVSMLQLDNSEGKQSVDDDVLDAVAELTNMVIGNIKNLLADRLGEMAISIPTVVYGKNFRFKSLAGMQEHRVIFGWNNYTIEVKVGLAPSFGSNPTTKRRLESPSFSAA